MRGSAELRPPPVARFLGATIISILRQSIDHLAALAITGQDEADAEAMIWEILRCAHFTEKGDLRREAGVPLPRIAPPTHPLLSLPAPLLLLKLRPTTSYSSLPLVLNSHPTHLSSLLNSPTPTAVRSSCP
jgi:hypothetical protein